MLIGGTPETVLEYALDIVLIGNELFYSHLTTCTVGQFRNVRLTFSNRDHFMTSWMMNLPYRSMSTAYSNPFSGPMTHSNRKRQGCTIYKKFHAPMAFSKDEWNCVTQMTRSFHWWIWEWCAAEGRYSEQQTFDGHITYGDLAHCKIERKEISQTMGCHGYANTSSWIVSSKANELASTERVCTFGASQKRSRYTLRR